MARKRFLFYGRVQGVGFRAFCLHAAQERGVQGWVRNRPDGSVELEAEASESSLDDFLAHVRTRHPWARIHRWESLPLTAGREDFHGFHID